MTPLTTQRRRRPGRELQKAWKRHSLPWMVRLLRRDGGSAAVSRRLDTLWSELGAEPGSGTGRSRPLRVLVVRQDNRLGNLVLLVPFLRALRSALPGAEVAMLTGEAYSDLVPSWPWVDRWIVQEKRLHATQPWRFPGWLRGLRRARWDLALEMSNHNTHSYYNCVLTVASGAPVRLGFDEPRNADALTHAVPPPSDRVPFAYAPLELLRATGLPADVAPPSIPLGSPPSRAFEEWRQQALGRQAYALVHIGGRGGKSWPLESWTRLVPQIRRRGGPQLVLIGGPDEIDRMHALEHDGSTREDGPREIVAPLFELSDLLHLLRGARFYLGCDTGVMHLAAAVGTPTVALFFRSNPLHYAPLGSPHVTVLLADPYHAETRWEQPLPGWEGAVRSRLLVAAMNPDDSVRGHPATGSDADATILRAIDELAREVRAEAGRNESP